MMALACRAGEGSSYAKKAEINGLDLSANVLDDLRKLEHIPEKCVRFLDRTMLKKQKALGAY